MNDSGKAILGKVTTFDLRFPFECSPTWGTWQEVARGVYWVRMPLPFALSHVNLWVLQDSGGWTVVDTGLDSPETRGLWERILADSMTDSVVRRVIVTHFHPDHFGLAGWLTRRFGAELWMSASDYFSARIVFAQLPGFRNGDYASFFQQHGVDGQHHEAVRHREHSYNTVVSDPPVQFHRIFDGELLQIDGCSWQVIVGYGHSPEHAALYSPELGILIAGDMLLPTISTNVSVWASEPSGDPITLFLRSIDKYASLPESTLVLPSHGLPFYGLRYRVAALHEHHDRRLQQTLAACERPSSAADIVPLLFPRDLDTYQLIFAMGEAISHLNHLCFKGLVARTLEPDGIIRFRRLP